MQALKLTLKICAFKIALPFCSLQSNAHIMGTIFHGQWTMVTLWDDDNKEGSAFSITQLWLIVSYF